MELKLICLCLFLFTNYCFGESLKLNAPAQTSPENFIHQAAVYGEWVCGAILITKDYVLAPAQCLNETSSVEVYLGLQRNPSFDANLNETDAQIFKSTEIIFHEDYLEVSEDHFINDIALIKLPEQAKLSSRIQPDTLMSKEDAYFVEEEYATLYGWTANNDSNIQLEIVQILNQDNCGFIFGKRFLENQEICIQKPSANNLDLIGNTLKVNGKILGFLEKSYVPCYSLSNKCEKIRVVRKLTPYLNWIAEKVGVPIAKLTGSYADMEANINGKIRNVLNKLDKTKNEIKALKSEIENIKNTT